MLRKAPRVRYARTDLSASTVDAVGHGSMVGLGETYIPAFALAAGVGEILSGLISTLPMMAGGLLQLVAPHGTYYSRSRRYWIVAMAAGQALSLLFLGIGAWFQAIPAWLLFALASLYWGTGLATGPAWNTWIDTLVPARLRAGYFARRTRLNQAALMAGIVIGGLSLNRFARTDFLMGVFAGIFFVAAFSRAVSTVALWMQREPLPPLQHEKPTSTLQTLGELVTLPSRGLLLFLLVVQASVFISAPFFNAYMLVRIQLSYSEYLVVLATAYLAKIVTLSFLGGVARRIGVRRLFALGSVGIVPLPVMWMFSTEVWYLISIQVLSGIAWAAYELGMFLILFEAIPSARRTEMLTLFNFGNVSATALGSLVGVILMKSAIDPSYEYVAVFTASMMGRLGAVICYGLAHLRPLGAAVKEPKAMSGPRFNPPVSIADSSF